MIEVARSMHGPHVPRQVSCSWSIRCMMECNVEPVTCANLLQPTFCAAAACPASLLRRCCSLLPPLLLQQLVPWHTVVSRCTCLLTIDFRLRCTVRAKSSLVCRRAASCPCCPFIRLCNVSCTLLVQLECCHAATAAAAAAAHSSLPTTSSPTHIRARSSCARLVVVLVELLAPPRCIGPMMPLQRPGRLGHARRVQRRLVQQLHRRQCRCRRRLLWQVLG